MANDYPRNPKILKFCTKVGLECMTYTGITYKDPEYRILNPIVDDIRKLEDEEFQSVVFEEYDEQFMYFFGAALLLFIIEMLIGERRPKRRLFE